MRFTHCTAPSTGQTGLIWIALLIPSAYPQNLGLKAPSVDKGKGDRLPPCAACRMLSTEFLNGLAKTQRSKFEGGDAAYEKERGLRYEDSEVRLIEIQEAMCEDAKKHAGQCRDLKEEHEQLLEDWYHGLRKQNPASLERWLCVEQLNICCDKGYFGPECKPCTGGAENPCSGHGTCRGSGSRKGNGTCKCHRGFQGDLCDQCSDGFFLNSTTLACIECDKSCETCREAGSKGCIVCKEGYVHTQEWGCSDVDECIESEESPCTGNTFCVNYEGGFHCLDCDKTCAGCYADGPDNCVKCAKGYVLNKGVCTHKQLSNIQVTLSRWAVHLGLIICTIIIAKKSITLSSVIGGCVAMYIGASEYTTGEWENFDMQKFIRSFAG
ncbi:cysteine-rich with EGF domain protein 2-like [Tropilaelaps mercedesae]|uniref:Cysteine-rich with EGF domain protein 2-like n=1 Tax=Tropilaelaps mercedesae TaxID=418985 RepID=A0A1V9XI11_9ACAR|nr:cysteine-rich with EGF domain protein 2-like [Tropilaelaps mercedesae]